MAPEDRFGRNLRQLREKAGLSQSDLATRLHEFGVSLHPSAIAKIEARDADNPRSIRLNEADAIARALGAQISELLGGPDDNFRQAAELFEQAVYHAEAKERWIDVGLDKIRGVKLHEGWDPKDASPEIESYRARIVKSLARLEELDK